jgi:hypothetical protein
MMRFLLLVVSVALAGCACAVPMTLDALIIAGGIAWQDPTTPMYVITAGLDLVACVGQPSPVVTGPVLLAQEIRVDRFDKNGQRQGYSIVDPKTGRIDEFDKHSNRTGFGYITTPPSSYGQDGQDRDRDRYRSADDRKPR